VSIYYNENEPFAAQWLRNLMAADLIALGEVDERDIRDVRPEDVQGFAQVHWFAGIGIWSHALREAGWPDDRPVWTGSCPCQPFSQAGKRTGFTDERHLWPAWFWLIEQCRPGVILGEQVANAFDWLDLVSTDLEGAGYRVGTVDTCAAGFGAPQIRQRLYWVAESGGAGLPGRQEQPAREEREAAERSGLPSRVANSVTERRGGGPLRDGIQAGPSEDQPPGSSRPCRVAYPGRVRCDTPGSGVPGTEEAAGTEHGDDASGYCGSGFWSRADWVACRDGKSRPVEPGTFPLAHGIAGRVGRLRAYGNALCAPQAEAFVRAYMEESALF